MNYRNPKLLKLANGAPCSMCGTQDGTSVWAHSNEIRHGKGMGIKAHDFYGAILCAECHTFYDSGKESREYKDQFFADAMQQTLEYLWREGLIRVA